MAILDFDAKRNKYAVYIGTQNDAPLTNPMGNLSRVKWHADLKVLGATSRTVTVNVNPRSWTSTERANGKALFPHGKSFRPLVIGTAWVGGRPVPTNAEFLIRFGTQTGLFGIISDTTSVRLQWLTNVGSVVGFPTTALNIAFDLHVCNMGITAGGQAVLPPVYDGVDVTPTRFRAGSFDTNDKHFMSKTNGEVMFYRTQSIDVTFGDFGLGVRQSVAGYTVSVDSGSTFVATVDRAEAL